MKLLGVEGLEVTLRSAGLDLKEHADESGPLIPSKGSTYVEALSGAEFAIHIRSHHKQFQAPAPGDVMACYLYLDGKHVTGEICEITTFADFGKTISYVTENNNGAYFKSNFKFADLATNDGATRGFDKAAVSQLGEVQLACHWTRKVGGINVMHSKDRFKSAAEAGIPEKCLKGRAISNQAVLGEAKRCAPLGTQTVTSPYGKEPFATFSFKYRSRRDLQIEGIISRDPTPVPLEDRDPDSLTADEARELVRRLKAKKPEIKSEVKKEKRKHETHVIDEDEGSDDDVTIASETQGRNKRHQSSRDSGVEIIDLSED